MGEYVGPMSEAEGSASLSRCSFGRSGRSDDKDDVDDVTVVVMVVADVSTDDAADIVSTFSSEDRAYDDGEETLRDTQPLQSLS